MVDIIIPNQIKELPINKIIHGDHLEALSKFPDNCIDLVVTSPPYDDIRTYKGYTFNFKKLAKELFRVMKDGSIVVWVVNDRYVNNDRTGTSFKQALIFRAIGFKLLDIMIYVKDPKYFVSNRYTNVFEFMLILLKGEKPKTFNPIKRINRNWRPISQVTHRYSDGKIIKKKYNPSKEVKITNIWYYSSGYMKTTKDKEAYKHPAIFPDKLAEDHIISWSNEGDVVLDPMAGSFCTCKIAVKKNRRFIGIDIAKEYCELGKRLIELYEKRKKMELFKNVKE